MIVCFICSSPNPTQSLTWNDDEGMVICAKCGEKYQELQEFADFLMSKSTGATFKEVMSGEVNKLSGRIV